MSILAPDWARYWTDHEADLFAQIADVEAERDSYRELLGISLAENHRLTTKLERTTDALRRLMTLERAA